MTHFSNGLILIVMIALISITSGCTTTPDAASCADQIPTVTRDAGDKLLTDRVARTQELRRQLQTLNGVLCNKTTSNPALLSQSIGMMSFANDLANNTLNTTFAADLLQLKSIVGEARRLE